MQAANLIQLSDTGRLQKTTQQAKKEQYEALEKNDFAQLEEIAYWISVCKKRGVKPSTLGRYIGTMRDAFNRTKTRPRSILPQMNEDAPAVFGSRKTAIEFAENLNEMFVAEGVYAETPQTYRVALRNLYDCYGLSFGHGMARQFKLGSHHDRFQPFKGAHIPLATFNKISQDLFDAKEFLAYTWFNTAVMTGARSGGVATMTWDKIIMSETNFEVQQHETKDHTAKHAGKDKHLGEFGEWHTTHPPKKLFEILKFWQENHAPKNSRFVWFAEQGSDDSNRKEAKKIREFVIPKLREFIGKYENELDNVSKECFHKEAGHLLRHTYAQLLYESGATEDQIADQKWKGDAIKWYVGVTEKQRQEKRDILNQIHSDEPKPEIATEDLQQ